MKKKIALILLLLLFLSGCKNELLIRNAQTHKIVPLFKEYISLQGYQLAYANDSTGFYRVETVDFRIPEKVESLATKRQYVTANLNSEAYYPLTSYEEKSWKTYMSRSYSVKLALVIRILQIDDDVLLKVDSDYLSEEFDHSNHGRRLRRYFKEFGYAVDFI